MILQSHMLLKKVQYKQQIKLVSKQAATSKLQVTINADSLTLIGCGLDHIILKSLDAQQLVVIFKRTGKHAEKFTAKNLELENIYFKFLDRQFKDLIPFIWPIQPMCILVNNEQELQGIFTELEHTISNNNGIKQIRASESQGLKFNRSFNSAYLSKNIFDQQNFNTIVEFKPKSILPDIYTEKTLFKLSEQLNLEMGSLKQILQQSSPVQKTRWFKKMGSSGKQNENPFKIFDVVDEQSSVDFVRSKGYKLLPELSKDEQILLNKSIHAYLGSHPSLLWNIQKLQSMMIGSPHDINTDGLESLQFSELSLSEQLDSLHHSFIQNKPLHAKQYSEWLRKYNCIDRLASHQVSRECEIMSFLIGLAWRDISLVYRANFNGSSFEDSEIWILDYYLKDLDKIQYNREKDEKLLRKYLLAKIKH